MPSEHHPVLGVVLASARPGAVPVHTDDKLAIKDATLVTGQDGCPTSSTRSGHADGIGAARRRASGRVHARINAAPTHVASLDDGIFSVQALTGFHSGINRASSAAVEGIGEREHFPRSEIVHVARTRPGAGAEQESDE